MAPLIEYLHALASAILVGKIPLIYSNLWPAQRR